MIFTVDMMKAYDHVISWTSSWGKWGLTENGGNGFVSAFLMLDSL